MDLARAPRRTARKKGSGYENALQRAKSTGGFFDRGVTGGVSLFQPIKSTYVK